MDNLQNPTPQASEAPQESPKKNGGGIVKTLLIGVAGGVIALAGGVGIATATGNMGFSSTNSGTSVSTQSYTNNNSTTAAIKKVSNAVVSVLNYQGSANGETAGTDGGSASASLDGYALSGEGSGVIYKKSGNTAYIVTNNHVIAGANELEVLMAGGQKVKATLVGTDSYTDIAVLKIDAQYVKTTAVFGDSAKVQVGETAIAVGSPLGSQFANTATEGIISALSRQVTMQNDQNQTINVNAFQTDAAINPGNSGGALINIEGQVIGITSSKISSAEDGSTSVEGMGFAIPSDDVVNIINQLEKNGKIVRPALGIQMVDLSNLSSDTISSVLHLPSSVTAGAVVASVTSGFPAANAGIKQYDVITKVGDTTVTSATDLQSALYKYSVGDTIQITFYRGSEEKTVSVKLTKTNTEMNTASSN